MIRVKLHGFKRETKILLRAFDLSGFVARNLSGCHIARGGRYEANKSAAGDTEDEIRRSIWFPAFAVTTAFLEVQLSDSHILSQDSLHRFNIFG